MLKHRSMWCALVLAIGAALLFQGILPSAAQRQITGTLSNFDVHNIKPDTFDNIELDFFGPIDSSDILDWYRGWNSWGNPPRISNFPAGTFPGEPGGLEVAWIDGINPFYPCQTRHFGLERQTGRAG